MIDFDEIMARSYEALRHLEWSGWGSRCIFCRHDRSTKKGSHAPDCELAAILATEADWKAHIARRGEIVEQVDTNTP